MNTHAYMTFVKLLTPILFLALLGADMPSTQPLPPDLLAPDAKVTRLVSGLGFTEGPVWFNDDGGYLVFSDIPANVLNRWDKNHLVYTQFRQPSNGTNGNTSTRDGELVSCEQTTRRVIGRDKDGLQRVIAIEVQRQEIQLAE